MMIGIYRHHPQASGDSCAGLIAALRDRHEIRVFTAEQCTDDALRDVDMLIFPGGVGNMDEFNKLLYPTLGPVRRFVDSGGAFLGVCMGAYWAGRGYYNILNNINVVQYIKQSGSEIRRSYRTVAEVDWLGSPEVMYFWDGPAFCGTGFKTIAYYKNRLPMAIMQNRIGLIGCHPEAMKSWFRPKRLNDFWHEGQHFDLLRDFVDELFKRK